MNKVKARLEHLNNIAYQNVTYTIVPSYTDQFTYMYMYVCIFLYQQRTSLRTLESYHYKQLPSEHKVGLGHFPIANQSKFLTYITGIFVPLTLLS